MYISYVLGQIIRDPSGEEIGRLSDLVATPGENLPMISAVVVRAGRGEPRNIAWQCFAYDEQTERLSLAVATDRIVDYQIGETDLLLATNLLDKQIVDVHDYRVVRVNDIRVEPSAGQALSGGGRHRRPRAAAQNGPDARGRRALEDHQDQAGFQGNRMARC